MKVWSLKCLICNLICRMIKVQKQPCRGVFRKRCSEICSKCIWWAIENNYLIVYKFFEFAVEWILEIRNKAEYMYYFFSVALFSPELVAYSRGWGDHVIYVIMTHCVRKWICDSTLKYLQTVKFDHKNILITSFLILKM